MNPLVSILVASSRPKFLPQLQRCFSRQQYQPCELIVESGETSMGAKLNAAAARARGTIFVKWDDDDWYSPQFLDLAVSRLRGKINAISAWSEFLLYFPETKGFRRSGDNWMAGGTMCFSRKVWEQRPFRDLSRGVDSAFFADHPRAERLPVHAEEHYVMVRHGGNTWKQYRGESTDAFFARNPVYPVELRAIWKDPADLAFYQSLLMRGLKVA